MEYTITVKDYGGNLEKRWYIDFGMKSVSRRKKYKRVWIPSADSLQVRYDAIKKFTDEFKVLVDASQQNKLPTKNIQPHVSRFLRDLKKAFSTRPDLETKTIQTYTTAAKFLDRFLTDSNLNYKDLPPNVINDFRLHANVSTSYFKSIFSHIRNIYSILETAKFVKRNPFIGLRLRLRGNTDSDQHYPYSDHQKQLIEDYLLEHNLPLYLATRFIFYAFLRPDELIKLQVRDIDLRTRTIRIKSSITKNDRAEMLPIIQPLLDEIIKAGILNYPPNFYIFGEGGRVSMHPCGKNTLTTQHRSALMALGIYQKRVTTLYGWKHTGNIYASLKGVDIRLIQRLNRHASLKTTEIYQRKLGIFQTSQFSAISW